MRYFRFFLILFLIIFSSVAIAGNHSTNMQPEYHELLDQKIKLMNNCSGLTIVEWRGTAGYFELTEPNKKSIKILNEVCQMAVSKFPDFIKEKGYKLDQGVDLKVTMALMPANLRLQGKLPRNLNDIKFRFSKRIDKAPKWGYYHRPTNFLYMRNDVLKNNGVPNRHFKTVFAHELYHVLSYTHGIYHQYSNNVDIQDEMLARDFSAHLGLGR